MMRRTLNTLIVGALLYAPIAFLAGETWAQTLTIDQQVQMLKDLVHEETSSMSADDKAQVKAALVELAGEL